MVKLDKKLMDNGTKTKYPKATPIKNKSEAKKMKYLMFFFSFSYKAGPTNFHNSHKIKGKAMINPAVIEVQINIEN